MSEKSGPPYSDGPLPEGFTPPHASLTAPAPVAAPDAEGLEGAVNAALRAPHAVIDGYPAEVAHHILASDWLATHDAAVRAEHGERIAQAIAASFPLNGELRHDGTADPQAAAYVEGLHDAYRIARETGRNDG